MPGTACVESSSRNEDGRYPSLYSLYRMRDDFSRIKRGVGLNFIYGRRFRNSAEGIEVHFRPNRHVSNADRKARQKRAYFFFGLFLCHGCTRLMSLSAQRRGSMLSGFQLRFSSARFVEEAYFPLFV